MQTTSAAIGIELIVEDLNRAVELFVDVMGCELVSREPSSLIEGEVAVVDAGNIVISLLEPVKSGTGAMLGERSPRLSQIIFGSTAIAETTATFDRAVSAGLSVSDMRDGRFHITPDSVRGALGQFVAMVTVPLELQ